MSTRSAKATGAADRKAATPATPATADESSRNGRVAHLSVAERAGAWERQRAQRCRGMCMVSGWRRRVAVIRLSCWRSRPLRGCRSWCRSVTGGWGLAVYVLSWRGVSDGGDRALAADGSRGAVVRGCALVELRCASRHPIGGSCSMSTTSTRRCPDRSSGSQAAGRELRGRGPRPRFPREQRRAGEFGGDARVPQGDPQGLASMKTFDLWYSRVDAEALVGQFQSTASAKRRKLMEKNLARDAARRTACGRSQSSRRSSTVSRGSPATRR